MAPERVLITGTTSGIGRALLEHYVTSGARVVSVNRRRVPELETRFPSVRFECVDVRAEDEVKGLVERLAATHELPELFILNAGINRVDNDEQFELATYRAVVDTNLYGVLNFVEPLTRLPASPTPRHVIAIGSMVTYAGNPYGLGYFTSKRALSGCFQVWSRMYSGTDLIFQQVLLGPVPTAIHKMDDHFPAWMVHLRDSFSGSLDGAAEAVSRFAATRRGRLFYPWRAVPLFLGMWLGQNLIPGFFQGRKTLQGLSRRRVGSTSDMTARAAKPAGRGFGDDG